MAHPKARGQQAKSTANAGHAKKPSTASRPVVPAIPLPFMQRQSNSAHAKKPSKNTASASSLDVALTDKRAVPDSGNSKIKNPDSLSTKTTGLQPKQSDPEKQEKVRTESVTSPANNATPEAVNGEKTDSSRDRAGELLTRTAETSEAPTIQHAARTAASTAGTLDRNTTEGTQQPHLAPVPNQSQHNMAASLAGFPPGFAPMPPPPASHPQHHQLANDRHADHHGMNGPPQMHPPPPHHQHRHHMSNGGGIIFGGFPDSHTPSPATAGGFMPPPINGEGPGLARVNGHHHGHSTSSGYPTPINTQFRLNMPHASTTEGFGQGPQAQFNNYPIEAGRYGPPTPHSFHGSHTSGEPPNAPDNAGMPFMPPNGLPFAGPPHPDHPNAQPHPGGPFLHFPPHPFGRRPDMVMEELMESVTYVQSQFDNGELADCVLELISTKGRHHPIKIRAHKLTLAKSPTLKQLIKAARAKDTGSHTLTVECDNDYLRSDAWWLAVQRLYMYPLLTLPPIAANGAGSINFAGDKNDRFAFCLGYAAAGHVLGMRDVLTRGLQVAAEIVSWHTVEDALSFALDGSIQRHTGYGMEQDGADAPVVDVEYRYGPETKILLDAVMNFLINCFPPNFEFDATVADPSRFARIPQMAKATPTMSPSTGAPPAIARGSTMKPSNKTGRLGSIKFGDLPAAYPDDEANASQREPAACSPVLSRILLNLPFDEFRAVMTSESNGSSGWNTAQNRYHAVAQVLAARESRRLSAVEAVREDPHSQHIQQRLASHRRHAIVEAWDVLNWQEELLPPRRAEVPRVIRKWVPQFSGTHNVEVRQAAPQPPYGTRESMV